MRSFLQLVLVLAVLACVRDVMAVETNLPPVTKQSVTNLLAHKSEYKGKRVKVKGYYFSYVECSILSQHQGDINSVSIWIHVWHVKPGYEKQIKAVPKGRVRVIGTFDFKDTVWPPR